jgi:hypothetical protein
LEPNYYELKEQIKKAASGKTIAQGVFYQMIM